MKLISEQQINEFSGDILKPIRMQNNSYEAVRSPHRSHAKCLVFISSKTLLELALSNKVLGFIIQEKCFSEIEHLLPAHVSVWTTAHIQSAMTQVLNLFDPKNISAPQNIHSTAIIHPDAKVSAKARVAPYAVIQQFAIVNDEARIGSHCVIEAYAEIGAATSLSPHVVVGSFCTIGSRCIIASHVTIGSDGFGFYTDKKGHHKIPQIGRVVIEDDCEIGAGCTIDRATLEETIIKKGSKLDNHCHIAHNVEIGENALVAAAFKVAGSTKIGRNILSGGNVDINGHIEICDNVTLIGRSGVIGSIKEPGIYGGFPCEPHRDNIKTMASIPQLNKIRKHVQKIMKHLKLEE